MAWMRSRSYRDFRNIGDRNLDRSEDRCAIGYIRANPPDADLTSAFRLQLNGKLGGSGGQLGIERRNLPVKIIEIIDGLRFDADLGKLSISVTQLLRHLLQGLELAGHLVPSLRANKRGVELSDLLIALGEPLQRRFYADPLFNRARHGGTRLLFAGFEPRKLLGQPCF